MLCEPSICGVCMAYAQVPRYVVHETNYKEKKEGQGRGGRKNWLILAILILDLWERKIGTEQLEVFPQWGLAGVVVSHIIICMNGLWLVVVTMWDRSLQI